jgi:aspartate kinase
MTLIVQKYGGSSLATAKRIRNVAQRIAKAKERSDKLVIVVSAMGKTTDKLTKLAQGVSSLPGGREFARLLSTGEIVSSALLAMTLNSLGYEAVSLTGAEAGIRTDSNFSRARIQEVEPQCILEELEQDKIVIVAGFQGVDKQGEITTLGRGGSDITAVVLAIALRAEECQIYTDVEGIYTADPRLVPGARKLKEINYEEMLEAASAGLKAVHPRAVELAGYHKMPILVASSFKNKPGTIVHSC